MNWQNADVVVTGGASFIGSHLVETLVKRGAHVEIIDNLSSGTLENISQVSDKIEFQRIDLHTVAVAELAKLLEGKYVFHLAAEHGGRGYVDTHPVETMFNIQLDQNVFWAAWKGGARKIVFSSSGCVYPPSLQTPGNSEELREHHQSWRFWEPRPVDNEYGQAKLLGETLLKYLSEKKGLATVSARLFSVYGPREPENQSIIAFIARAFIKQDPFQIWGDGTQRRNYTYVTDIVDGIMRLAEEVDDGNTFNVGNNEAITVKSAVDLTCQLMKHQPSKIKFDPQAPTGPHARTCDYSALAQHVGWRPKVSFRDGLQRTIDWYVRTHNPNDVKRRLDVLLYERGVSRQFVETIVPMA